MGCYRDTANRAIPTLEGKAPILDGQYLHRANPIAKCAVAAMNRGYEMFAVQNGGWCAASAAAPQTYDKYGQSLACKRDGEGGSWANQVYLTKGTATLVDKNVVISWEDYTLFKKMSLFLPSIEVSKEVNLKCFS